MKFNNFLSLASLFTYASFPLGVLANVEKTIFIAPDNSTAPLRPDRPLAWHFAALPTLTGTKAPSLRTDVQAEFPTSSSPSGAATWVLLDDMVPGQRYEARVMWVATQPTAFRLDTFPLAQVVDDEELFSSYTNYAISRANSSKPSPSPPVDSAPTSKLLLRVMAEAEYFTDDEGLMERVRPVPVDFYLDPYILNVVPLSLLPALVFLVVAVPAFWVVALHVCGLIAAVAQGLDGGAVLEELEPHENSDKNPDNGENPANEENSEVEGGEQGIGTRSRGRRAVRRRAV